jgi:hypothetical protein
MLRVLTIIELSVGAWPSCSIKKMIIELLINK